MRSTRSRRVVAIALALLLATAACTTEAGQDADDPSALADGPHTVRVEQIDSTAGVLTVDPVDFLSGQEAQEAAVEDGAIPEGEDLPNDFYIRNSDREAFDIPLGAGAAISLLRCPELCVPTDIDRDDFLAGGELPMNGEYAVYDITVASGEIVAISERYIP